VASRTREAWKIGRELAEGNPRGALRVGGHLAGSIGTGIRARGLKRFVQDLEDAEVDIRTEVNGSLRTLAERGQRYVVQSASGFRLSQRTISGYKPRASKSTSRRQWASVDQTRRKVTGLRPDYGRFQQERVMDPVAEKMEPEVARALEQTVDHTLRRHRL
jgi:hypothetical protein